MIAVLKHGTTPAQTQHLVDWLKQMNLDVHVSEGTEVTILGLIGDTSRVDIELLSSLEIVESVRRIQEPYKSANRKFHPENTIVDIGGHKFGGKNFQVIAGPCSVESEEQIIEYVLCYQKNKDSNKFKGVKKTSVSSNGLLNQPNKFKPLIFPANVVTLSTKSLIRPSKSESLFAIPVMRFCHADCIIDNEP